MSRPRQAVRATSQHGIPNSLSPDGQGEVDHQAVAPFDLVSIEPVNGTTRIAFDVPDDTDMEAFAERLNRAGLSAADIVAVQRSETDADVADAATSRKRAVIELLVVAGILVFISAILQPQFIDYGQVIEAMRTLTLAQVLLLFVLGMARIWFEAPLAGWRKQMKEDAAAAAADSA